MNIHKYFPGQEVVADDLNSSNIDVNTNIRTSAKLLLDYGILNTTKLRGDASDTRWDGFTDFGITVVDDTHISIGSGIAYDAEGNIITIPISTAITYDIANLTQKDSLLNLIPTSTGNINIPLPYTSNYVYIYHIEKINTSTQANQPPADNYTIDPDTGDVNYTKIVDGYAIEVFDTESTDIDKILLAVITTPATLTGNIDISSRIFCKVYPNLITTALPSDNNSTTLEYVKNSQVSINDHLLAIADTNYIAANNPHGLTMEAIPNLVDSLGMFSFYPETLKTNGILTYGEDNVIGPLFPSTGADGLYYYVQLTTLAANHYFTIKNKMYSTMSAMYAEVVDSQTGGMSPAVVDSTQPFRCYFANNNNDRLSAGYYMLCMTNYPENIDSARITAIYIGEASGLSPIDLDDLVTNPLSYLTPKVDPQDVGEYLPIGVVNFDIITATTTDKELKLMTDPRTGSSTKVIDIRKFGILSPDLLSYEPHFSDAQVRELNLLTINRLVKFNENITAKSALINNNLDVLGDVTIHGTLVSTVSTIANVPTWYKVTKTYAELSAAATINSIDIYSLPAAGVLHGIKIKHSVSFDITGYKVSVGIIGDTERYASLFDVNQAVDDFTLQMSNGFFSENQGGQTAIQLTAQADANLDGATQGSVDIWLLISIAN